jgi:hypothetical protein
MLALRACAVICVLVGFIATMFFALSLADLYALTLGGVRPGDPMLGDRFAPPLWFASLWSITWAVVLWGAVYVRRRALVRISAPDDPSTTTNPSAVA